MKKRLADMGRSDIEVSSAGVMPVPGMLATDKAVIVTKEAGADISGHAARMMTVRDIQEADLIFAMQRFHKDEVTRVVSEAADKTHLLNDFRHIGDHTPSDQPDIPDPIGKPLLFYQETFKAIQAAVERVLAEITQKGSDSVPPLPDGNDNKG